VTQRILVVDDNPTNLKLACEVLECEGYEIWRAMDAEQAQEIVAAQLPDLILMDIGLPGMDGLSLTRLLKAEARTREIPIVALTAFAMKGDSQKAFDAGCNGYITKPLDIRRFPQQIAEILQPGERLAEEAGPEHIRVMVIEDDPLSRKLFCVILEAEGHQVTHAESAETALHFIKKHPPDMIILDLKLPQMDGLALTRELKRDEATAHIPIVAITAHPDRWDQQMVLQAGCDLYVEKPVDTRKLIDRVKEKDTRRDGKIHPTEDCQESK
jgi:two-component system, cell cycle response regulator